MVVVEYASRLSYRNCFEISLPLLGCPGITGIAPKGDIFCVDVETGLILNRMTNQSLQARPIDSFLMNMIRRGGLIPLAASMSS